MEYKVINTAGEDTGRVVELSEKVNIKPNDHCIYLDVKQYLANQRQGTHKTKERADVSGSTRKIKKQKGTGTARAGSIKSPIFRGGGTIFGPKPRNYSFKLNKKIKALARLSALTYKVKEDALTVIEDFTFEKPQTKAYLKILQDLHFEDKKTLFLLSGTDKNVFLSARNLKKTKIAEPRLINTYDLLNADHLVVFESAVEKLNNFLNH